MAGLAKAAAPKRKPRKAHEATVIGRRQISPDLVRLSMNSPAFVGKELEFTDHYIKLLFVPTFPKLLAPVGFPIGATKDGEVVFVIKPRATVQG